MTDYYQILGVERDAIAGTRKAFKELVDGTLRVQIDIEPRNKAQFHKLFPEIDMPIAIAPLKTGQPETKGSWPGDILHTEGKAADQAVELLGSFGDEARQLRQSSFFRRPEVWAAIGTDAEFQEWCRHQKCIVCGDGDWLDGELYNQAAHVRRVSEGAGTSIKPAYSTVSLCTTDHILEQHQHGETAAYRKYLTMKLGNERQVTLQEAKDWFDRRRIEAVQQWAWETLKAELGCESWKQVYPPDLLKWAEAHKVAATASGGLTMPRRYYDTYPERPARIES
ncbi:MAG TPA: hypothetical protein ENJ35_04295 [Gammaproteobacteria bacterium]|nr:hypothetical protein [Gammaproteobacteria bacterium]